MDIGRMLVSVADAIETASVTDAARKVESPPIPKKFSLTERTLVRMMRENTGASILDSGGAYGRAWQRALTEDFSKRERATIKGRVYESRGESWLDLDVTIDLFSYLAEKLEYDRAMTRAFERFAALPENADECDLTVAEAFPEWYAERRGLELSESPAVQNSYNEDNFLSGTIQVVYFTFGRGEHCCVLQVHGGCDVRGGYTRPKVFRCSDEWSIFDWYRASVAPDWTEVEAIREARLAELDRQTFLTPEIEADYRSEARLFGEDVWWDVGGNDDHGDGAAKNLEKYPCRAIETRAQWVRGTVCTLPDRTVLCPETGARLVASF